MPEERKNIGKHKIVMEKRENISVTGVMDVLSFDEENIITETEYGMLILKGSNLHVNSLNLERGELEVDGYIESIIYEDNNSFTKGKGSLFSKIFK